MRRTFLLAGLLASVAATSAGVAVATGDGGVKEAQKPIKFAEHDLYIEYNATDRDAGLQLKLDGEDWRSLEIRDTKGDALAAVEAKGRLRSQGLTELFFEASEPSFDEVPFSRFKKRFPEGRYSFNGQTVEGRRIVASDSFTHVVPAAPKITNPAKGATVDPSNFTVTWEPVTRPAGVDIVRYIVVVTQEPREITMELPGSATSATVPPQFLEPGTKTAVEVLAREKSGNQTITSVEFRTK